MATVSKLSLHKGLHIEAQGCIVNIYEGLHDLKGNEVTAVEMVVKQEKL